MNYSSNQLFYLISIDSFFNGILFMLIYNIKLSKKDKIEYYNTFILSAKIRYLYFLLLWIFSLFINTLFFRMIDMSILACPLFVYFFYKKLYFHRVVEWINRKTQDRIQHVISWCLYNIIQFLCKTVLSEETNIKMTEIRAFYQKVGYSKLIEFAQSFVLACVYDYISTNYTYLGFVFNYNNNFRDNYDKKQHILGYLNSKDWDRLFHSSTINLFFDIYKNSNNKQIARYIQYQINRLQYKLLILFSTWSIVGYMDNILLVPLLFYYINLEDWKEHRYLYATLSVLSLFQNSYFLSIMLFIISNHYYYQLFNWIINLQYNLEECVFSTIGFAIFLMPEYIGCIYCLLGIVFYRKLSKRLVYYLFFGYFSSYHWVHGCLLFILHNGYSTYIKNNL